MEKYICCLTTLIIYIILEPIVSTFCDYVYGYTKNKLRSNKIYNCLKKTTYPNTEFKYRSYAILINECRIPLDEIGIKDICETDKRLVWLHKNNRYFYGVKK